MDLFLLKLNYLLLENSSEIFIMDLNSLLVTFDMKGTLKSSLIYSVVTNYLLQFHWDSLGFF